MKLNQIELATALGMLTSMIEHAGASEALTKASMLATDLRRSIGDPYNESDPLAIERVAELLGGRIAMPVLIADEPTPPPPSQLTPKEILIVTSKEFRIHLDDVLQKMKALRDELSGVGLEGVADDPREVVPNMVLSIRHVEDAIMRQGMFLKAVGGPKPYPESYNTESTVVDKPVDGIKL